MNKSRIRTRLMPWLGLALIASVGCGGRMPENLGFRDGSFQPCPDSPNCVSSFASDEQHAIAAFQISGDPEAAWEALESELSGLLRVEIASHSADYIHAVFTTKVMRYRDDVEFYLDSASGEIALRSASRVGHGDMGANRERIESIRASLLARGVIRS